MGGESGDDLDANRDEIERLRYPRWEVDYRLEILDEHPEQERMLAFAAPPRTGARHAAAFRRHLGDVRSASRR